LPFYQQFSLHFSTSLKAYSGLQHQAGHWFR
jgi:hypothetical protein